MRASPFLSLILTLSLVPFVAADGPRPQIAQTVDHASEKRFTFAMREVQWDKFCDWLRDATEMGIVSPPHIPLGTFTFIPPSATKSFTIPEIMDIINEALAVEDRILVNRKTSFIFMPCDRIRWNLLPFLPPGDLVEHGSTELVSLLVPLKRVKAEDAVPQVKKLLSSLGEVSEMKPDSLNIRDRVGTLRRIVAMLEQLESTKKE